MQGLATAKTPTLEVVAAWMAAKREVQAVTASPGWVVVGQYYLTTSTVARLDVQLSVSHVSLTARARLWDMELNEAVAGTVSTSSMAPVRLLGGKVTLAGGRNYQIQVECIGGTGDINFAVLESATISD